METTLKAPRQSLFAFLLTGLVIALYICTVFSIPQNRLAEFGPERYTLAAAISHVFYGARFGKAFSNINQLLVDSQNKPLQATLDNLPNRGADLGTLAPAITDGVGVGFFLVAAAAMRLFGPHVWGLQLITIAAITISAFLFLLRFGGRYAAILILYFTILIFLEFTPIVYDWSSQISFGAIRYFSMAAVIPAYHIYLEIIETGEKVTISKYFLLILQTAILFLSALVRGSPACLAGMIAIGGAVTFYFNRRDRDRRRVVVIKGLATLSAVVLLATAIIASLPHAYVKQGRATTVFWHRAIVGLGANPDWPFGDLASRINCKQYIPEGLVPGFADRNGHCFWAYYVIIHNIPVGDEIYGKKYEAVLRNAFFQIVAQYPQEVLETLAYYKPLGLIEVLPKVLHVDFANYPKISLVFLALSLSLLGIFGVAAPLGLGDGSRLLGATTLFTLSYVSPIIVAWAAYWTVEDLVCGFMLCLGMIVFLGPAAIKAILTSSKAASRAL